KTFKSMFLIALLMQPAWSATVNKLQVTKQKKYFETQAEFVVDAPQSEVLRAFTMFENLQKINPAITGSSAVPLTDQTTRVTTEVKDCMGVFCKSLTLVEDVTIEVDGTVHSVMVAGLGDFEEGTTTWTFVPKGDRTQVLYQSRVRPGFWLPPLVGKKAMRKALKRQITTAVNNLEAILAE
ncbi:MAG: SRPBCC family protein, partial [Pseudomonadota bacterium]